MADRLRKIFGTEEDKVNCVFYFKIGACRHGDGCTRVHVKPNFSQTVLFPHFYAPPPPDEQGNPVDDTEHFEDFYDEVLDEMESFGDIEEMIVTENLGDHLFGNAYVKFTEDEMAEKCLKALNGRYYAGRILQGEYSPVTDFRDARCRQHEEGTCTRGGYCNFMHCKKVPRHLRKRLKRPTRAKGLGEGGRAGPFGGGGGGRRGYGGGGGGGGRDRGHGGGGGRYGGGGGRHGGGGGGYGGGRDGGRDRGHGGGGGRRRSRSRERGGGGGRDRAPRRSESEERRATIAKWNEERAAKSGAPPPSQGAPMGGPPGGPPRGGPPPRGPGGPGGPPPRGPGGPPGGYAPPQQPGGYAPPQQPVYAPPQQQGYAPPQPQGYAPPPQQGGQPNYPPQQGSQGGGGYRR